MTDEPTHDEIHVDDNQPATKGDVRHSQEELATMMADSFAKVATKDDLTAVKQELKDDLSDLKQELKHDIKDTKQKITETKSTMKRVLEVVETIEENTRDLKDLPARVAQTEDDIMKLKSKSF